MSTPTAPIVWDKSDPGRWLKDPLAETTRHADAMNAQWPEGFDMAYMPHSGSVCMAPAGQAFDGWSEVNGLCGSRMMGPARLPEMPGCYSVCSICTDRYNHQKD